MSELKITNKTRKFDYVIYHGKCSDGTAGAWSIKNKYPDAILIPYHCDKKEAQEIINNKKKKMYFWFHPLNLPPIWSCII